MELNPFEDLQTWAQNQDTIADRPDAEALSRYQDRFACSHEEAIQEIRGHQADLHDYLVARRKVRLEP